MPEAWDEDEKNALRILWNRYGGHQLSRIAAELGVTRNAVLGQSTRMNLHYQAQGARQEIPKTHRAIVEARTLFPSMVQPPSAEVLKPGKYQRKLGSVVLKGAWKGFPIFSLSLEERATCPVSCKMFRGCYGNGMHRAVRYSHGHNLDKAIWRDLQRLQHRHPDGFVVRLHLLGDFMSVAYVDLWEASLDHFPALRVFGYTHRQASDPIGQAVHALRDAQWGRFAIRTSSGPLDQPAALTVDAASMAPTQAIICPAQTGKTQSCGTCGLCWARAARGRPVAFLRH